MSRGFIPPSFIEDLIARIDIVELINMRVPLKRAGNSHKACCPFHQEKTASFHVSQSKQVYHCFGCGAKGTAINFIMDYERLEFVEAIEYLAHFGGLTIPYERGSNKEDVEKVAKIRGLLDWLQLADQYFQYQLRHHASKNRAVEYLKNRGLTGKDAVHFNIGFAPDGWNGLFDHLKSKGASEKELVAAGLIVESSNNRYYDRFRDRIIFPIRNRKGETIGFGGRILDKGEPKYLNSPESPVFFKGQELYGLYELRKAIRHYDEILVVEGYMDVVMLAHFEIQNAVATLGTATSSKQIEQLFRHTQRIVFCFDGDEAGKNAAHKAMNSALPVLSSGKELAFLFLPDNEDPDSFVQKKGKEAFLQAINEAIPLSQYLFSSFEKRLDLNTIEGRSQLLEEMGALLNQMPDTPLRDLLRTELAMRTNAQEKTLGRHAKKGKGARNSSQRLIKDKTLVERALIILLNNLSLGKEVEGFQFLLELNQKGANVLYQVITTLVDYPHIQNVAQLLLIFKNEPWIHWIEELSLNELTLAPEFHLIEFNDFMRQLAHQSDPLKQILLKMKNSERLTEAEKQWLK